MYQYIGELYGQKEFMFIVTSSAMVIDIHLPLTLHIFCESEFQGDYFFVVSY